MLSPTTCFKDSKMLPVQKHQRYHHFSDFDKSRIVALRKVSLFYRKIAYRVNFTAVTVMCVF